VTALLRAERGTRQDAQVDRDGWMTLLDLEEDEVPRLLVLEGTWWRQKALDTRLPLLTEVRELGMPDLWHGWYGDLPVAYCPAYGSPRAVEPVHVLGTIGTPNVVQIGSCGSLQPEIRTGDIVLSERALIGEGASQYYGGKGFAEANLGRVTRASSLFVARDTYTHRGTTVTTDALLAQPPELLRKWANAGHLAVDMETSAVFSAARAFGMRAASLLFVWDELPGRSWTDSFTASEQAAQARAGSAVFEVALEMA
jgi:uridine phosphorylase